MTHLHNQKGFSLPILLAILLALAVIALGGWYVWKNNQDGDTEKSASKTSQSEQGDQNDAKPSDPSEGGKYLVIEEWGVRFLLPEELKGDLLTYVSNTQASGTVSFASKKLNELAGDDSCSFVKQPDGSYSGGINASLARINPVTYPESHLDDFKDQLNLIKALGAYEYYSSKSDDSALTCATAIGGNDPIPGLYESEQEISKQLKEAFSSIENFQ